MIQDIKVEKMINGGYTAWVRQNIKKTETVKGIFDAHGETPEEATENLKKKLDGMAFVKLVTGEKKIGRLLPEKEQSMLSKQVIKLL